MARDPVAWLYDLQHAGVKLGLDNIRALLDRLGHPEHAFTSVLVAGTNGKGSVAAMLEAMLRTHGVRSGMFTSPHLVRPNERIRIDGDDISAPGLDRVLRHVRERIETGIERGVMECHPSFFEVVTASALQAFHDADLDCAVLEIGMGGRLDATNVVDAALSVVVTVDYDHVEKLGPTLERIAGEKAAIVKQGRPLVTGVTQKVARSVMRRATREAGSTWVDATSVATLDLHDDGAFDLQTPRAKYPDLRLSLAGRHQAENARVAVVALETLASDAGFVPEPDAVRDGLAQVRWPGRLQWIDGSPPLLLDGAHNPAGARALRDYLLVRAKGRRPVLLFNAMRKKAVADIVEPLSELLDAVVITRASVERSAEPDDLVRVVAPLVPDVEVVPEPSEALARARERCAPDGFVLVAGSLYLVGEVLGLLEDRPVPGPVPL